MTPTAKHNGNGGNGDDLDRLLPVGKVCEILSTTDRSLRRWVILGIVPQPDVRLGRNLRWKSSTIQKLIDAGGNGGPGG